jgi:VanZ family protein
MPTFAPNPWLARLFRWCVRRRFPLGAVGLLVVFAFASIPNTRPPLFRGLDKLEHVVEYGALTLLFINAATRGFTRVRGRGLLLSWVTAVCVSLLDENYQRLIPGRSFDLRDVAASASGGLIAVGTVMLAYAVLGRPARELE